MTENGDKVRLAHLESDSKALHAEIKELRMMIARVDTNQKVAYGKQDARAELGKWVERIILVGVAAAAWIKEYVTLK